MYLHLYLSVMTVMESSFSYYVVVFCSKSINQFRRVKEKLGVKINVAFP